MGQRTSTHTNPRTVLSIQKGQFENVVDRQYHQPEKDDCGEDDAVLVQPLCHRTGSDSGGPTRLLLLQITERQLPWIFHQNASRGVC